MPKISIILPVYNGAKYLENALHSLRMQSFTDFVCYIINANSNDATSQIIKSYSALDTRFISLSTKYAGKGSAYNLGLNQRLGDYTLFMEYYHVLESDALATLLKYAPDNDVVLAQCRALSQKEDAQQRRIQANSLNQDEFLQTILLGNLQDSTSAKLFRTEAFKSLRFKNTTQLFCNTLFVMQTMKHLQNIVQIDKVIQYTQEITIQTFAYGKSTAFINEIDCLEDLMEYAIQTLPSQAIYALYYTVEACLYLAEQLQYEKNAVATLAKKRIKNICKKYRAWYCKAKHIRFSKKLLVYCLSISYRLYCSIYHVMRKNKQYWQNTGQYILSKEKRLDRAERKEITRKMQNKELSLWAQGKELLYTEMQKPDKQKYIEPLQKIIAPISKPIRAIKRQYKDTKQKILETIFSKK